MAERVHCLYRVSTTKQVDHDELNQADIPVQRKACREFADKMGWVIVNEEQETGVSGYKVSANDRDKLQLIKKRAEQGKFDILLVFMFDRLGRKSDETPFVVEWFVKHGVRVWSVNEGEQRFESHTDRLTNYIRYWQADGESQKTSIRTKAAMSQMVQEGRYRGGGVPYGYKLVPSGILNKRKHEVLKLKIDEDEARVVRLMFNLCVGSGYGRSKIANMISNQGIKTRTGSNWHEATVGHILHNVAYTGVLRSGESHSEIFEELQIVDPDTFALAQKLMAERVNEFNEQRTMPKNINGQALLSGNIFCGHCGGRLTLTTNGTVRHNLKGGTVFRRRVRYVCYNKTRHRVDCDGQTGYTTHILDNMVTKVLHQVFDKMKALQEDEIVSRTHMNMTAGLKDQLAAAKKEFAKATKEYESVKNKLYDVIRGRSSLPESILTEMADEAKEKMMAASEKVSALSAEVDRGASKADEIRKDYQRILKWSELFDDSDIATKKMVAGYLIKRIDVYTDYRLYIEFNINFAQFELGLDIPNEYRGQRPA